MFENKKSSQRIKKSHANEIELKVNFLDDKTQTCNLKKRSTGADLLNQVFDYLNIEEREYFGIERIHNERPDPFVNWIDPNKPLLKYVITKDERQNCRLQFRVKFFATDPSRLQEECTRHQFYLQIRRDIYSGKLDCSLNTQCLLAGYIVQAELGDNDPFEHPSTYLRDLKLIPNQTEELEQRISANHKILTGLSKDDAENCYLEHAMKSPLYGVYFFKSKDSTGKDIDLGIMSLGVIVYQNDHIVNEFSWSKMVKIAFKRRTFFIELKRELTEDYNTMLGFKLSSHRHAKIVWKTCVEHHSFFRLAHNASASASSSSSASKSTSKQTKKYFSSNKDSARIDRNEQTRKQLTKSAKTHHTIAENRLNEKVSNANGGSNGANGSTNGNNGKLSILSITKSYKTYDNKVTSKQMETIPRMAWEQQVPHESVALPPSIPTIDPLNASHLNAKNLITVSMQADEFGRFGFNVRGGVDLNLPVLVALIAPNSPADCAIPKIKKGDEVLLINGHDVNGLNHEQVVNLIKATRDHNPNAQLVLTIKPGSVAAFVGTGEEEPICQYVPDTCIDQSIKFDGDTFSQSLLLLRDGLASGALLEQFETLYKRNSTLTIADAESERNVEKNRYRDILPYDYNRIKIAQMADIGTDYINANYVNMKIPNDCINRYIASQGPMENTLLEFWRMVQQENSTLIIMLTTIIERGRNKCFQYWPPLKEQMKLSETFSITLLSESTDDTESYVLRRIALNDSVTGEYREVRQLQYLSWPDHGVPSDRTLFMNFVDKIREMRQHSMDNIDQRFNQLQLLDADASDVSPEEICKRYNKVDSEDEWIPLSVHQYISAANPPIIVHCSAGIGRTGMLILLDTALSLLNVNEPVYPWDIVKHMRDQRPCMVQNVFQYKFICECIFAAYAKLNKMNLSE